MNTSHDYILWIATLAYALHVMEEFAFDWKTWAVVVMKFDVDWPLFYVTNGAVMVGGICLAMIGWRLPEVSLAFPALMVINAVFLHIVPIIRYRQFSPGIFTALVLFVPIGIAAFVLADADHVLTPSSLIVSIIIGAFFMIYPILLLSFRARFSQYRSR